jgi:hypothetical protein
MVEVETPELPPPLELLLAELCEGEGDGVSATTTKLVTT